MNIEARGVDTLAQTAHRAADELRDLQGTHQRVGDLLLQAADPPVNTGRLQDSLEVLAAAHEVILATDLEYAPYVHARNPFLTRALAEREAAVIDLFLADVADVVTSIQGA